ncbi:hypothetical protein NE237_030927 [Protea cynaroides]|uniref:PPPDE domain-containing protein n=1 Tax=Protea cynaroides TaxID=273540 RepID=A0A9Q0JXE9_9MAGN|nr:hypothetical protein NE237_030927 [Protea cynaroides]
MGLAMSFMGKGMPSAQMLGLVTDTVYKQFISEPIENFEDFHVAILDIFNSFNSALPGRHYDVPTREDVKTCYDEWQATNDPAMKKQLFMEFMTKKVTTSKLDNTTMLVGVVTPPAAMVVKRAGENVPQIGMIKAIPDVIFVPSATLLALISRFLVAFGHAEVGILEIFLWENWLCGINMLSFLSSSASTKKQSNGENLAQLYLNVYDLTPINNYLYWIGLGIYHSGIEVHGMEFAFGAHEYPTSGVFEVEPKCCPGFVYRRSVLLGSTDMTRSELRLFMEHISGKYHGDTYHLIAKNCNHFTDDVCIHLTGKCIPGWVNRLARLGSFCNCLLPEIIQTTTIRHLPDHQVYSENGSESVASSSTADSEEGSDHHLLTIEDGDVAFINKPVTLAKELLVIN